MEANEVQQIVSQAIARHEKHEQELADRQRRELMEIVAAVRADLHVISAKLSEVADLRGEMKTQRDFTERLGRESKEHDQRLRVVEIATATQGQSTRRFDGLTDKLLWATVSALVTAGGVLVAIKGLG